MKSIVVAYRKWHSDDEKRFSFRNGIKYLDLLSFQSDSFYSFRVSLSTHFPLRFLLHSVRQLVRYHSIDFFTT